MFSWGLKKISVLSRLFEAWHRLEALDQESIRQHEHAC